MNVNILELLDSHGIKKTTQRIAILEIINESGHIGVEDIYSRVKNSCPTMSLATVYKNIEYLLNEGILKKVLFKNKKDLFEIVKEDHYHIIEESQIIDIFYTEEQMSEIRNVLNLNPSDKIDLTVY
jgi:Fe2+ or Zn2+ uptake regulation protein